MWMRSRSAEYRLFYRARLQKRPIISRSLLIVSSHSLLHELLSSTPSLTPVVSNTRVCLLPTLSRVCASHSLSHASMCVCFARLKANRALLIVFRALFACVLTTHSFSRLCFLLTLSRIYARLFCSFEGTPSSFDCIQGSFACVLFTHSFSCLCSLRTLSRVCARLFCSFEGTQSSSDCIQCPFWVCETMTLTPIPWVHSVPKRIPSDCLQCPFWVCETMTLTSIPWVHSLPKKLFHESIVYQREYQRDCSFREPMSL